MNAQRKYEYVVPNAYFGEIGVLRVGTLEALAPLVDELLLLLGLLLEGRLLLLQARTLLLDLLAVSLLLLALLLLTSHQAYNTIEIYYQFPCACAVNGTHEQTAASNSSTNRFTSAAALSSSSCSTRTFALRKRL